MIVDRQSRAAKKGRQVGQAVAQRQRADQQSDEKAAVANAPADDDLHADRIDAGKQRPGEASGGDGQVAAKRCEEQGRIGQCGKNRGDREHPARVEAVGNAADRGNQRACYEPRLHAARQHAPAGRAKSRPRAPCRAALRPRRTTGSSRPSRRAPGGRRTFFLDGPFMALHPASQTTAILRGHPAVLWQSASWSHAASFDYAEISSPVAVEMGCQMKGRHLSRRPGCDHRCCRAGLLRRASSV